MNNREKTVRFYQQGAMVFAVTDRGREFLEFTAADAGIASEAVRLLNKQYSWMLKKTDQWRAEKQADQKSISC